MDIKEENDKCVICHKNKNTVFIEISNFKCCYSDIDKFKEDIEENGDLVKKCILREIKQEKKCFLCNNRIKEEEPIREIMTEGRKPKIHESCIDKLLEKLDEIKDKNKSNAVSYNL
jgi:hypothetical protein